MPKFVLEDVPDDLVEDLIALAKQERRTLENQILYMLETWYREDQASRERSARWAAEDRAAASRARQDVGPTEDCAEILACP